MESTIERGEAVIAKQYKMTTEIPAGILTPDTVETRLGTLKFFDGFPDEATVQKVYDNLDFQRAVQAYLTALPAAWLHAVRTGCLTCGPANQTLLIAETLLDSRILSASLNTETVYFLTWCDTKEGPLVIEIPPNVLGFINDIWSRYVTDVGRTGPDQGKGGKYLLLPPDYMGEVPEGYFVVHSRTYGNILFSRGFVEHGDMRAPVENIKQHYRVYPLDRAANPPANRFVNISGQPLACTAITDVSLFEHVATVVQEEPLDAIDSETRGLLAAVGIRKDKPFAPNARMQSILADAAAVANATGRAILYSTRHPDAYYYPNSAWKMAWIGNDIQFSPGGVLDLEAREYWAFFGWSISPAMTVKMVGVGSQYAFAARDAAGQHLDGGKTYRLHLPPHIPVKDFWSVIVHDTQTRSFLQTDQQFPSLNSQKTGIIINPDTSVDIYFGPEPPAGKEANWLQTIPGKGWFTILRLYGPLEPWFDKTWRPEEIELLD